MNNAYYAIMGGGVGLIYGIYCLIKLISVRKWPSVEGRIVKSIKSNRSSDAGRMEDADIAYEFSVAGKAYLARVIQVGGDMSSSLSKQGTKADAILTKYPVGAAVTVYYNPRFPQMACLERADATAAFVGIVFGTLAIAIGYLFLR